MSASAVDAAIEIVSPAVPLASKPRKAGRVLLALGTERAPIRALREAHRFAQALGAELHVIRVVPTTARLSAPSLNCVARALREAQRVIAAARHTRKLCDRVLSERLPIKQLCIRLGVFVDQVALRAAELGATTIAVAPSHQRLGSAAMRLARETGCAVLIPRGHSSFLTVVAATDLRDANAPVLRKAAHLANTLGAASIAVHSMVDTAGAFPPVEDRRASLERATRDIDGRCEPIIVRALDAAQGVLEQARANHADLIVVGVRPASRCAPASSTTARVIKAARQSVLIAPLG
jgi:nucleotide-binding universal stress UspA family protein